MYEKQGDVKFEYISSSKEFCKREKEKDREIVILLD